MLAAVLVLGSGPFAVAQDAAQQAPASQPAKVQPVDYRKLKELLPADAAGQKRSRHEGEKVSIGEFVFTKATADYAKEEPAETDPNVTIEIMDYGASPQMAAIVSAWQQLDIDKESDGGYEKTTKIKDQPAYEQYRNDGKSGEVQIWVASRYHVNVRTTNLSSDDLKKLVQTLPIEKLKELK
jgi:hypothetical protein